MVFLEYLVKSGILIKVSELIGYNCIGGVFGDWILNIKWLFWKGGEILVSGCLFVNDIVFVCKVVFDGFGIGLLVFVVVVEDVVEGWLLFVFLDEVGVELLVSLVYFDCEYFDLKVWEFVDRVIEVI